MQLLYTGGGRGGGETAKQSILFSKSQLARHLPPVSLSVYKLFSRRPDHSFEYRTRS